MMAEVLKLNNLSGGYYGKQIVKDISLGVDQGEFIGIIGPNGSGKTTLLRLMSRALLPQKGRVEFFGKDIYWMDLKTFCQKVAFVSQDSAINFPFSVFEMVLMGRIPHQKRMQFQTKHDIYIVNKSLDLTDTAGLAEKRMDELSSGERQRVIIAKALAQEPVLLFLDEPTSHLDIGHQIQILDLLKKLNIESNLTIIMVLHDLNMASEYCGRIVLLNEGMIFKEGTTQEVLTYQNIEAVYKAVVVVRPNPINSKPYVLLVPGVK